MNVRTLAWDSSFFGFPVEKITISNLQSEYGLLRDVIEKSSAKVIYIFTPASVPHEQTSILSKLGAIKYDTKTVFEKITKCRGVSDEITRAKSLTPEIEELAYAAGWNSRYNIDPLFHPYFKKLYKTWIKKSFDEPDTIVLAYCKNGNVVGMITLSCMETIGEIGLFAVSKEFRGGGIGRKLLDAANVSCFTQNKKKCRVTTQYENVAACNLYLDAGYKVVSQESVWHLWK